MNKLLLLVLTLLFFACKPESKEDPAPKPIDKRTILLNHKWNTFSHKHYFDGVEEEDSKFECTKDDIYSFNTDGTYLMAREGFGVHCHLHERDIKGTWYLSGSKLVMTEQGGAPIWDYTIESLTDSTMKVRNERLIGYSHSIRIFQAVD